MEEQNFQVGDIVIGNKKASFRYGITTESWIGKVMRVSGLSFSLKSVLTGDTFEVAKECFDLYTPKETKEDKERKSSVIAMLL